MLSAHVEVEDVMQLLVSEEANGYLLKSGVTGIADVIDTLQQIAGGASVLDPVIVQELVSSRRRDDLLASLSNREYEVLALMAKGRSNVGIARRLGFTHERWKSMSAAA